ncbi:MAG: GNAT family N-acetyltransferase [Alphaproteobacteria bacterium]|nr:GNAT family N-acetyltransferase [Alphaproteobacteria bacterium]
MTRQRPVRLCGHRPGALGWVVGIHGTYYAEAWNFGPEFEAKVAAGMGRFLAEFEAGRDGFWLALVDDRMAGSVSVDRSKAATSGAHLRWFIVDDRFRGQGIGRRLLEAAIGLCRDRRDDRIYL